MNLPFHVSDEESFDKISLNVPSQKEEEIENPEPILNFPPKIKTKGAPKKSKPIEFTKSRELVIQANYPELEKKFTHPPEQLSTFEKWLNDSEIVGFLTVLKQNLKIKNYFEFMDPILLKTNDLKQFFDSKIPFLTLIITI